ncbi:MAG: hypothetical protein DLM60_15805 [Pseudonocardiales bacterium]|nr:ATP-binding protein [Actinomycetota bacterium]PZS16117.1 MAG: hypothetical protein DLM60_15805 [Pseudonocardiales bacterium]
MPLSPRFRRVAALERRFVNRESALAAFTDELSRVADRPRVLNVVGVGGIGKSRLLRELRNRAAASDGCRTAVLDLQVPAMRQQENALAVLRTEFGRQKVSFDGSTSPMRCCGSVCTRTCGSPAEICRSWPRAKS